ncbi:SDR family NAD(P)-dependent oxidoreductase [Ramlibacter alkalitolerans]|uniref:SDR family oxidoreductase n=1 Tax=Ramlibacter alkalitolerans TaxID=2039631 RepID=A0ABS1JJS1_9BURK|nr:SDR family NAD(P)-dependent oxidoreductase [Ramlibacter alkalitolerans]MBL0424356.1 SDR family oxidoreductase [Ramlibacter alkalitolerans]
MISRVALVTGGGRNIGRAIALALARESAAVIVNVRSNEEQGRSVVREIEAAGGQGVVMRADVADRDAVDAMVARVKQRYGRLDVLVNNAAVREESAFDQMEFDAWRKALAVCLDGAFHCTQAALPLLKASGQASIVNIGGLTAHTGASRRVHVVTAKAGLVGMTRALATELSPQGITVNCVAPGLIDTSRPGGKPHHHASRRTLVGRAGLPEEVAQAVCWLAGPHGRYVTGQVIHVNGGAYLGG